MYFCNWGFNNFYMNNFMPMPFWGGCGCNAFNTGFKLGIFNSLINFMNPQMSLFSYPQNFTMQMFNPYNNIFTLANNFSLPAYNTPAYNFGMTPFIPPQVNIQNYYTGQDTQPITNNAFNTLINTIKTKPTETEDLKIEKNISAKTTSQKISSNNNTSTINTVNNKNTNKTINTTNTKINNNIKDTGKLDINFLNKVKQVANNLNCDYRDLLALINSESGLRANAWNGNTAVGLIQFTNASIAELNQKYGLNLTKQKIASMSPIEQLDLAEKYLMTAKSYSFPSNARLSAGDLYAITFLPGRANREVLCSSGEEYYSSNRGLDKNRDGRITKSDLAQHLQGKQVNESIFA